MKGWAGLMTCEGCGVQDIEKGSKKNAEWRAADRGVEKMVTNDRIKGARLKNNGDGNIMRGAGARDGMRKGGGLG